MFQPNYFTSQTPNPLFAQQQRLMQLEQQQRQNMLQPQGFYLKGRTVTGIEEVRGAIIDQDGSLFIFPDLGHSKIYTKQINIDGTATINSFALEELPALPEQKYVEVEQMDKIINGFNQQIQVLQQKVDELTSMKGQEKSSNKKNEVSW